MAGQSTLRHMYATHNAGGQSSFADRSPIPSSIPYAEALNSVPLAPSTMLAIDEMTVGSTVQKLCGFSSVSAQVLL